MVTHQTPVQARILRDGVLTGWDEEICGRWHYRDLKADENWRHGWISFDAITWSPDDGLVYCGLNSIDGDLLYSYDPANGAFASLCAKSWTDEYDVKIHRTLLHNQADGCFYFATSLLHDVDEQHAAKGGKLVKFDPRRRKYEILSVPFPMLYIQSIAADFPRGLLYGFTYPAESFFVFDLATRQAKTLAYTGNSLFLSQPHNAVVDSFGWVWGTYAETRAWDEISSRYPIRLFKYHPDRDQLLCFDYGLPSKTVGEQLLPDPEKPDVAAVLTQTRHPDDFGFCDSMLFDGHRYIYVGTVAGVLCRIDTWSDQVDKIAHVMATGRFPALAMGRCGTLYGAGGMNGHTQIMRWRPGSNRIDSFHNLWDPSIQDCPARIHDLIVDNDETLYLAENDNHRRPGYLWTSRLPDDV